MLSVTCQCGKHYRVPDRLSGKRVKCKSCSRPIQVGPPPAPGSYLIEEVEPHPEVVLENVTTATAANAASGARLRRAKEHVAAPESSLGNYFTDCMRSLMFIVEPGNFAPFLIVSVISMIQPWFKYAPCIGWLCILIIEGWVISFYFNTMLNAAGGRRELPELAVMDGWLDDIFIPLFKYLASWAIVLWPAIAYGFFTVPALSGPVFGTEHVVVLVLTGAGVFMWPMSLLLVGLGGVSSFARPDLIFRTLLRTFVPYVLTCLLACLAMGLFGFLMFGAGMTPGGQDHPAALEAILELVNVYLWIIVVRFIGLYYYHFKDRFAWDWG